ncbi:MAG: phenylalanine--tRNA ligase subunit alpha, partial [Verrucomicrobiota bacterium]|nr:phenylalanine--tRNA ligase subunit alpha [Verrucomicrobiota bacterium]
MSFVDEITPLKEAALQALKAADNLAKLDAVRVQYLGTNGQFTGLLKQMGGLAKEERPAAGKAVNQAKAELTRSLDQRREQLELVGAAPQRATDFTAPGRRRPLGKQHPLTQVTEDIVRSFRKIGFAVANGPEIESERYCFDALNTPADHPARDTQDTFFLNANERPLLRTHTSSVQIRVMEQTPPPIRIIVPGRTFRADYDATHSPMFHQIEGLVVDETTHMGHLKGCLIDFCRAFFYVDDLPVRFRPSYFPFT